MKTLEEIAKAASVSRSTVSRVINNEPRVSAETRQKVWEVIRAHDYRPNTAARALAGRRSYIIGLVHQLPYETLASDPFFALLSSAIAHDCEAHGYFLMLSLTNSSKADAYSKIVKGGHLDGLIVYCSTTDETLVNELIADDLPFVVLGRPFREKSLCSVDVDNYQAARGVAHHLADLGYQRYATITGPRYALSSVDRRDGFLSGLEERGVKCHPKYVVIGDFTEVSAYNAMQDLLALSPRPEAVFAANDAMALGAMRAVRQAGLRVPADVAVVGFDDMPFAAMTEPPLTTVRQSAFSMGKMAFKLLHDQIQQGSTQPRLCENVVMPAELVVRESCGAAHHIHQAGSAKSRRSKERALINVQ